MPKIGRSVYHKAMEEILESVGYRYQRIRLGKILIYKNGRKIYVDRVCNKYPSDQVRSDLTDRTTMLFVTICYANKGKYAIKHPPGYPPHPLNPIWDILQG